MCRRPCQRFGLASAFSATAPVRQSPPMRTPRPRDGGGQEHAAEPDGGAVPALPAGSGAQVLHPLLALRDVEMLAIETQRCSVWSADLSGSPPAPRPAAERPSWVRATWRG